MDQSFFLFLQKSPWHLMLFGTALVTGGMLVWPLFGRLFTGTVPQVGALEAVQLINRRDALVLDVRDKAQFAAGHIPNAKHIPLGELPGRVHELDKFKARPLVVNCQAGMQSAKVCATLKKLGFSEVFALRGGLNGWAQASMPVVR